MAKKSTTDTLVEAFVIDAMLWLISFWTAFLVMVLEGAVASNLGFRTLGYWTCYFGVMLVQMTAGVIFRPLIIARSTS